MRTSGAAQTVVDCVCNATIPWPTCNSLAGLHSDVSLSPMIQQAAGDVVAMRQQLARQARMNHARKTAGDYGAETQAWQDVWRMRRSLKQTCDSAGDFAEIMGGAKTGCECLARAARCAARCAPPPASAYASPTAAPLPPHRLVNWLQIHTASSADSCPQAAVGGVHSLCVRACCSRCCRRQCGRPLHARCPPCCSPAARPGLHLHVDFELVSNVLYTCPTDKECIQKGVRQLTCLRGRDAAGSWLTLACCGCCAAPLWALPACSPLCLFSF